MNISVHTGLRRSSGIVIVFATMMLGLPKSYAEESNHPPDPLVDALEEIDTADWDNRWLGYGIALVGSAAGIGMGSWALYEQPLSKDGRPDLVVFASSLTIVGVATTQIVHGGMRFDERVQGAETARQLLGEKTKRSTHTLFFLQQRARSARSTRFWGGVMTTAQGLGTTVLGARLWAEGSEGIRTTGIVLTGLGLLNTAIGAVHFPGKPRSERVLDRTRKAIATQNQVHIQPSPMYVGDNQWVPGLFAGGRF